VWVLFLSGGLKFEGNQLVLGCVWFTDVGLWELVVLCGGKRNGSVKKVARTKNPNKRINETNRSCEQSEE